MHVTRLFYLFDADSTKSQLAQVIEEKERLQKERGEEVSALTSKLHLVEKSYEAILQVSALLVCVQKGHWHCQALCAIFLNETTNIRLHVSDLVYYTCAIFDLL